MSMDDKTGSELLELRRQAASLVANHKPEVNPGQADASRSYRFRKLAEVAITDDARRLEGPRTESSGVFEYRRVLPFVPGIELHLVAKTSTGLPRASFEQIDSIESRLIDAETPDADPLAVETVSLFEVSSFSDSAAPVGGVLDKLAGMEETVRTAQQYADFLADAA